MNDRAAADDHRTGRGAFMLDLQLITGTYRSRREGAVHDFTSLPGRQPASSAPNPPNVGQKQSLIKAAPPALLRKASLTVEAAGALPIFLFALCSLICMLELYGTFCLRMVKLQEQAERAGQVVAAAGSLTGREEGLGTDTIDLPLPFSYRARFVPAPSVMIAARGRVHAWTGRGGRASDLADRKEKDPLVYVTDYESVYHTSSQCTHLHLQISGTSYGRMKTMRNASGARYKTCQKCAGKGKHGSVVYISPEGDCWHNDPECSGLKRSTHLVHLSEAKGVHKCQRCQQREGG